MHEVCLVSIIIPIYNVKKYLGKCLDSILNQSFRNFELILVDDGSKDNSFFVCNEYKKKDDRIKIIRKKNSGAASARNAGIKVALGKYILFIDADDYIENNSLEQIFEKVKEEGECDVTFLEALSVFPDGKMEPKDLYDKNHYYKKSHLDVLSYLSAHDPLPVCVWGKLIKRQILINNEIYFTDGIICEDVDFCLKLYMYAKTYNYIDVMYYYYIENREGSVMDINTDRKYYDLFFIISQWVLYAKADYKVYSEYIYTILAFQYCMLLPMYQKLPKDKRMEERKNSSGLAWLLSRSNDRRIKLLNAIYKVFGFGCTLGLLVLYDRFKKWVLKNRGGSMIQNE